MASKATKKASSTKKTAPKEKKTAKKTSAPKARGIRAAAAAEDDIAHLIDAILTKNGLSVGFDAAAKTALHGAAVKTAMKAIKKKSAPAKKVVVSKKIPAVKKTASKSAKAPK